ncbi:MAG: dihydrofolate reductase family protein [Mesorhizobium sp.]
MGRIVFGMMLSLDGYIAGPNGITDLPEPEPELHWYFNNLVKRTAVSLYGRRMYETMKVWQDLDSQPDVSEVLADFARAWRAVPKVVVSTTLTEVGPNASLVRDDIEAAVLKLKADTQGEIAVSGAALAGSLSKLGLIDEYQLFFRPVVVGGGTPFFELGTRLNLKPLGWEELPQGTRLLRYGRED